MKRILISLCLPLLVCVFIFSSYAEVTIEDYEGGTYTGEVSNGVLHGQGTFTYADGSTYIGEWKDSNPWNGTYYDQDQNVIGTFSDGVSKEN